MSPTLHTALCEFRLRAHADVKLYKLLLEYEVTQSVDDPPEKFQSL